MDLNLMTSIEHAELHAWKDMYDAAPPDLARRMQLSYKEIGGGIAFFLDAMPLAHFNMAIGLGVSQPLTKDVVYDVVELYSGKKPRSFMMLYFEYMRPEGCNTFMERYGLEAVGAWERIYRDNSMQHLSIPNPDGIVVEEVTEATMHAWADLICNVYGLPFQEWLHSLQGRKGWCHFVARKGDKLIASRSFCIGKDGWTWSGIEGPVPGVMTSDHTPDLLIWEHAINILNDRGASHYVADIEKVSPEREYGSYHAFLDTFNFKLPYTRIHYTRDSADI